MLRRVVKTHGAEVDGLLEPISESDESSDED
jgi:hypothetical protein